MNIENLIEAVRSNRVLITAHADGAAQDDGVTISEVIVSVLNGEIIETYPDDKPYPSCLVYGMTSGGEPLHSVWGYDEVEQVGALITVYRPDLERWVDWRVRRR